MNDMSFANLVKDLQVDDAVFRQDWERLAPADRTYVVVFAARSGSTWLTSVLSATKRLGYPEEYINPEFVRAVAQALNTRNPECLLQMLKRRRSTPNGVFGIEVRAIDVALLGEETFFRVFDEETFFFNLWRENIVAQSISLFRAVATRHYHSIDDKSPPPPSYDADQIRRWLCHIATTENDNLRMLHRARRSARHLCYEDIIRDREGTVTSFARALDVSIIAEELAERVNGETRKIGDGWNVEAEHRFRSECANFVAEIESKRLARVADVGIRSRVMVATATAGEASMLEPPMVLLPDHQGQFYQECLRELHRAIRPKTYIEIGTLNGDTLRLASCHTIAIDPVFQLAQPSVGNKPALHLFQMKSDSFFASYDPIALLGGRIDLAFLDGMHLFEFLLRDFINIERASHAETVIVLHDCVPLDQFMATRNKDDHKTRARSRYPLWWTGDVWKLVPTLQHYRTDLTITLFDAPPTGIVVVTGLDPTNRVLSEHYGDILSAQPGSPWHDDSIGKYLSRIALRPTADLLKTLTRNEELSHIDAS